MKQEMSMFMSSETCEWYTPGHIIELARKVMGSITLDPASCEYANTNIVKADFYYDCNGLELPWYGNVWLNPPYGRIKNRSSQGIWAKKMESELLNKNINQGILLVRAALGYPWFEELWDKWPACFVRDLLQFVKSDGTTGDNTAKHGHALFYIADNTKDNYQINLTKFIFTFRTIGRITIPDGRYYLQS